ncbi:hypothetical protein Taro_039623 [Colocasia esculenta]|uniref:Uncharacterized protein n=1 Tax=Colocasia esculenta TaxID=4460 RepID=A0A843W6W4_COLES|nr:hypothetical protein [Colocasia esculenta]
MVLPAAAAAAAAAVGVVGDDGIGDGMQCSEHPQYYNQRANPGGICPLCLQEKLGRLVSSSPNNHGNSSSSSPHLFYPSALAAPPYYSDSPSSPPSSLRPTVGEAAAYGSRAGGGARGTNSSSSSFAGTGGQRRASLGNRAGNGGRSRMIPFLYSTHGKKKPFGGSGSSSTTTRTSSGISGKIMSSTTSSSSLSAISTTASSSSGSSGGNPVFKRSKSVVPRPTGGYPDGCRAGGAITEDPEKFDSPRKKSFWSFLYLSSSQQNYQHHSSSPRSATAAPKRRGAGSGGGGKDANGVSCTTNSSTVASTPYIRDIKLLPQPPQLPAISTGPATSVTASRGNNKSHEDAKTPRREYPPAVAPAAAATIAVRTEEADDSPGSGSQASASFGRKVARSRSVGCGSRSFSGDFLERISTVGFGDCTLRRVESQREAKPGKTAGHHHRPASGEDDEELPPQRVVRCGGIFGGFYSSSSSSSYWLSDDLGGVNSAGRISTAAVGDGSGDTGTPHSRRSWAWATFASPMRAFRQSASSNKHASAVSSVNGVTQATGRTTSSSTTALPGATTPSAAAALLAVKG